MDLIKYRKDNKKAYGILINLVSDPSSVNAVMGAKTPELPKGCVRTAFKNLLAIYDTKNDDIKHEIQQKFNKSELTSNDKNPFWDAGRIILCTHGFVKKRQTTPPGELDTAARWKKAYDLAKKAGNLEFNDS